jgi:hypothetical protein
MLEAQSLPKLIIGAVTAPAVAPATAPIGPARARPVTPPTAPPLMLFCVVVHPATPDAKATTTARTFLVLITTPVTHESKAAPAGYWKTDEPEPPRESQNKSPPLRPPPVHETNLKNLRGPKRGEGLMIKMIRPCTATLVARRLKLPSH